MDKKQKRIKYLITGSWQEFKSFCYMFKEKGTEYKQISRWEDVAGLIFKKGQVVEGAISNAPVDIERIMHYIETHTR